MTRQPATNVEILGSNFTEQDCTDIGRLVSQLSTKPRTFHDIQDNLGNATESHNTLTFVTRDTDSCISAMATVSFATTLRGPQAWIDDVVVEKNHRRTGLSKSLMDAAEEMSSVYCDDVRLTSSTEREEARAGYAKRGYRLFENTLYRKKLNTASESFQANNVSQITLAGTGQNILDQADTQSIADMLQVDYSTTERNIQSILEFPFSALFVRRSAGRPVGAATVNLCPIPTGCKPWLELQADSTETAALLTQTAENWTAQYSSALNTTFIRSGMENYEQRDSGLYVLSLGESALNHTVQN